MAQKIKFGGKAQGKSSGGSMFSVDMNYNIDMVDHDRIPGQNCTILSEHVGGATNDTDVDGTAANKLLQEQHAELFGGSFRVNQTVTLGAFIDFATTNNLRLAIVDDNGANHETLVARDASDSL
jgi:hypothetical protein